MILGGVQIRRNIGRKVRPEAEAIDGKTFWFRYGWKMDAGDPYPGEHAYIPADKNYPDSAPVWLASGDLALY